MTRNQSMRVMSDEVCCVMFGTNEVTGTQHSGQDSADVHRTTPLKG